MPKTLESALHFVFATLMALPLLPLSTGAAQQPATHPQVGLQQNPPRRFLLTNAKVVVAPGQVLESADVRVEGNRIVQVGSQLTVSPGTQTIDCTGKTIYPGLIDAYSETETPKLDDGTGYWNSGVTPRRNVAQHYKPNSKANSGYRKSGFVARLLAPKGGQIKGLGAIVSTSDSEPELSVLQAEVAMHISLTVSRRGRDEEYPGSPMGAMSLVRQAFYDARWYREAWRAHQADARVDRPELNSALAALNSTLDAGRPIIVDAGNERYALRADQIAQEFSLPIILRGSGREYRRLSDVLRTGRPIICPLNFPKAPDVSTPEAARMATLERLMHWDHAPENPAALVEGGATIAFTSHGLDDVKELRGALRKAIRRGLSPDEALAALTTNPADLFGVDELLGSIESGKLASFVITDGDLFVKKNQTRGDVGRGQAL